MLNLQKNELEMLARFMGHDIAIHREFYRLPEDTLQLAKCSKIMLLMEKGEIGNFAGKKLSEIEISLEGKKKSLRLRWCTLLFQFHESTYFVRIFMLL